MNELLFIGFGLFLLTLNLIAFRMGRLYVFALVAVYTVLMNIFVTKQFDLFGLAVTGGNALYAAVFLLTDLLSEHYGKKQALKAVGVGFAASVVFVVATQVLLAFTPNEADYTQDAMMTLFSVTPRILVGSMLAYLIAQSLDVWLYTRIRAWTGEKWLWLRNNGSTLISQLVDTFIFTAVGLTAFAWLPFEGVISPELFWPVFMATYIVKVLMTLLDTPFLYLSYKLKRPEMKTPYDA